MQPDRSITAVWHPSVLTREPVSHQFDARATIQDMIAAIAPDEAEIRAVLIAPDGSEHELDPARWHVIRLKAGQAVSLHRPPTDQGGNRSGKGAALFGLIITLAAVATAGFALAGGFAAGGFFAAGSVSAKLLGAAISLAGALARSALTKPPASDKGALEDRRGPASVTGNVLAKGASIPRVIGTRRIYPPMACQPLVERIGSDEYAEAVYLLAGPHRLQDIRLGDSPIANEADIEMQIREGWNSDTDNGLVARYAITKAPQIELSSHALDRQSSSGNALENKILPEKSLPRWHAFNAKLADELWLHLTAPEGMYDRGDANAYAVVPFRIRMRKLDSDPWINLPELHFSGKKAGELRISVLLKRKAADETVPGCPISAGFVAAFKVVLGQVNPVSDHYSADGHFSSGAGNDGLYAGVEFDSNVARTSLYEDRAEISLDPALFDSGEWKFEIKRGASYQKGTFSYSGYPGSQATDWFHYKTGPVPPRALGDITDRIYLLRTAAVTNSDPVTQKGMAVIAIRARGRAIDALSVQASGYVRDHDGTGWTNWVTTSNPAPHFRDVLTGALSADPLPQDIIDETGLVAWRSACITAGWTCDLVCEGAAVTEVLDRIASCGYARPYASEIWGVVRDYDRSAEVPIQMFTQRNSANVRLAKGFSRLPDGFRCVFRDNSNLDSEREIIVWRKGREGAVNPRLEEIRYEGLATETAVIERAKFDLAQGVYRAAFWSFEAPAESIRCRRGSLVSLSHDMIDETQASARIVSLEINSGAITAVITDAPAPMGTAPGFEDAPDVASIADIDALGRTTAMEIRDADGVRSYHLLSAIAATDFGSRVRLVPATPIPLVLTDDGKPVIRPGNLVQTGTAGRLSKRLIVADISLDKELRAQITCVAEAPELWS